MWAVVCALTVAAGLASRAGGMPAWVHAYVGDALYAALIYGLAGVVAPGAAIGRRAGVALAICVAIELSQAWHPPWLDALRAHRAVALVLGRGFLASDLVAYTVGVAATAGGEALARRGPRGG
ncbi:MAG: DUF2809 domain-containing protein [Myxococcota bacterium]